MTARRLRAYRPPKFPQHHGPHAVTVDEAFTFEPHPKFELAPGHFDGDGCVFPQPGHFAPKEDGRDRSPD